MSFSLELTPAQHDLVKRTHRFAEEVVRPVAAEYDRKEEFPWPVLEQAAEEGFYNALFYRDLIADPTGLSLPLSYGMPTFHSEHHSKVAQHALSTCPTVLPRPYVP